MSKLLLVIDDSPLNLYHKRDERRTFNIECLGDHAWPFCSQVHDMQAAVDWCAAFRMQKGQAARVVEVSR